MKNIVNIKEFLFAVATKIGKVKSGMHMYTGISSVVKIKVGYNQQLIKETYTLKCTVLKF